MNNNTVYANFTQAVGNTPLVRLQRFSAETGVELLAKVESFNPLGSIKDRVALAMIDDAENRGILQPGRDHCRADQRQYRHWPGLCQRQPGIPPDPDHAREHEHRAAQNC